VAYANQQRGIWLGKALRDIKSKRLQLVLVCEQPQQSDAPVAIDVIVSTDERTGQPGRNTIEFTASHDQPEVNFLVRVICISAVVLAQVISGTGDDGGEIARGVEMLGI
jgi:hypothetical protein